MFISGIMGWIGIYIGLFENTTPDVGWPAYAGAGFIALAGVFYLLSERARPYYRRVQQLNRKYLLEKAGPDAARCATLREVLEYYPAMTALWTELAEQYAAEKQYTEAIAAARKARELEPENVDCVLIEASFLHRVGEEEAMAKALNEAEKLRKIPSDPRIVIYRGALALRRNDKKGALRYGREAMDLDGDFTEKLVQQDEGLRELGLLWEELFRKNEKSE
jgi:tetratricopeptide (TPR) repeat protein